MRRKRFLKGMYNVLAVTLLVFFALTCAYAENKPKILKIGCIAGMSGFASGSLVKFQQGSVLAADWINDNGGITVNGQKYLIELITEDTQCSAQGAAAATTKIVYDHKCKLMIGGIMPFINAAAASVTEPNGVLRSMIYNCATPAEYGPRTPMTFVTMNDTVLGMITALAYLAEARPEVKTLAVTMPDDGTIKYLFPHFKRIAEENGMKVLGKPIAWPLDLIDFTPIAQKAVSRKPDAICSVNGWPAMQGGFLKALRQMGYDKPFVMTNYQQSHDTLAIAGKEASTNAIQHSIFPGDPKNPPLMEEIYLRCQKKYGECSIYPMSVGFDNLWCLTQAIEAAQSLDPVKVKEAWEKMATIDTVFGTGRMGGLKTYGIKHSVCHPMGIVALIDGEPIPQKWMDMVIP